MQKLGDFKLPHFFNYPPYFTLQPVRETREKQIQLWKELILDYCRTQKIFVIKLEEEFPLFSNSAIERTLSHEAREAFLSDLVAEGRAEWLDKGRRSCLILWHRIQDWADIIVNFVKDNGFEDSVMTVEEIRSGIESRGTSIHTFNHVNELDLDKFPFAKGKLAIFKGTSTDDEGIKFSV
ncbi:vacuolar protein sorting-associated protein 25-like isoform X3 [Hibiscus syriacus]|uniref:vacuolar protein sorting-associated protein 25-like isoform X3 n=1 Tax=Hibiscus syriacus TaxID=106335 RepID=UPI0019226ED2|nr:vacuolar protein sorting-associated protein 25-like isoform X3 [Hibiscus syriacus]